MCDIPNLGSGLGNVGHDSRDGCCKSDLPHFYLKLQNGLDETSRNSVIRPK